MPYRRSSNGQQGTRSGVRPRRRGRTSVSTRARYQRPSASNQRNQIRSLAKIALANRRMLTANKVWTDWYDSALVPSASSIWSAQELMGPVNWDASNRQDADFLVSQTAYVRNMVVELYMSADLKTAPTNVEIYIVSLRNSAANWSPGNYPTGVWSEGLEYTSMGSGNAVSVNSGIFKVHYAKMLTVSPAEYAPTTNVAPTPTGNPFATYRRVKANLALNCKLRAPAGLSWKNLRMDSLPPSQRMWLVWRGVSSDTSNTYTMNWGIHVTAVGLN